jgi:hypothetical protein
LVDDTTNVVFESSGFEIAASVDDVGIGVRPSAPFVPGETSA